MTENQISYKIRGAIFDIYSNLGPGLLESVYVKALEYELNKRGLIVKLESPFPVYYKENSLDIGFRIDILVED